MIAIGIIVIILLSVLCGMTFCVIQGLKDVRSSCEKIVHELDRIYRYKEAADEHRSD